MTRNSQGGAVYTLGTQKSNLTNGSNLEKAYEDLEREIKDIKSKL
jgi:hypothetical protein